MPITAAQIEKQLHTRVFGRPLYVHEELASTNDTAKALAAAGAPEGTAVVAGRQTAGRGRRGRTFASAQGGVYLSFLLRPNHPLDPGMVTSCAAVAVARAIRRVSGVEVGIKWVNDLLIDGKKVCGILAEGGLNAVGGMEYMIVGIGVNVATVDFPPEVAKIATSLAASGVVVDPAALVAAILEAWEAAYATLASGDFLEEYRRRSVVLGHPVTVWRGSERFPAVAEGIDHQARLLVRTAEGLVTLDSGEVSVRL